jgi:hypothetical protein
LVSQPYESLYSVQSLTRLADSVPVIVILCARAATGRNESAGEVGEIHSREVIEGDIIGNGWASIIGEEFQLDVRTIISAGRANVVGNFIFLLVLSFPIVLTFSFSFLVFHFILAACQVLFASEVYIFFLIFLVLALIFKVGLNILYVLRLMT